MGTYRRRNCGILPRGKRQILVISWRHLVIKRHIAVLVFFRNIYQFQCWECHTSCKSKSLTHWVLNKISATCRHHFQMHLLKTILVCWSKIHWHLFLLRRRLNVNKSALVQLMTLCLSGAKSLPEPMLIKMLDVLWCQQATSPHWLLCHLNDILVMIDGWGIFFEIALRWMPPDLSDQNLTLVQVMAWCLPATSVCLSQCRISLWCHLWPLLLTWFNFNPSMDK